MGVLYDIFKKRLEYSNGRIRPYPANWVLEPTDKQRDRELGKHGRMHTHKTATGQDAFLIKQRGVTCSNPAIGDDDKYARFPDKAFWWIPQSRCRKCQYYRKGGTDRLRYPHCAWQRARRGGRQGALADTTNILKEAKAFTDDIMGKRA